MNKNIIIVDENGKEIGTTYAKRAKGLVKNGRARFISENKIILACPTNIKLEDKKMFDKFREKDSLEKNSDIKDTISTPNFNPTEFANSDAKNDQLTDEKEPCNFTISYILNQLNLISSQTDYLNNAITEIGNIKDTENSSSGEKAKAIAEIIKCKETSNQQLIALYEKMYDDLKTKSENLQLKALNLTECTINNTNISSEDKELLADIINSISHIN
ncbi:MAG: hypothetical protein RR436_06065 [Clostridia bacterium]